MHMFVCCKVKLKLKTALVSSVQATGFLDTHSLSLSVCRPPLFSLVVTVHRLGGLETWKAKSLTQSMNSLTALRHFGLHIEPNELEP